MSRRKVHILVVEDELEITRALQRSLTACGYEVLIAHSGELALQLLDQQHPDLILLDIGLPSLNGIEAARQIRKLSPTSKIVFLTQDCSPDMVQEALDLGAWGYVGKFRAGTDLLPAIEAVMLEKQFVST